MAEAKRDENFVPTMLGLSEADGTTIVPIEITPTGNHPLSVDNGVGGSDLSGDVDARDENRVPIFMAISAVDGTTPVPIYATADGKLLINSN